MLMSTLLFTTFKLQHMASFFVWACSSVSPAFKHFADLYVLTAMSYTDTFRKGQLPYSNIFKFCKLLEMLQTTWSKSKAEQTMVVIKITRCCV